MFRMGTNVFSSPLIQCSGARPKGALSWIMFITGLGVAVPPQRFTQRECWDALRTSAPFTRLAPRSRAILRKVLCGDNGIATRHLALDPLTEAFDLTPDALQARFARHAPALAARAAQRALKDANCKPRDMDAVLISTCTGYLCPGLTSYVSERLDLRPDVFTLDLVGQGCGAALPNLRTAEAILAAGRAQKVLSVCVEICSAAFYLDDDPGVLISACLFGDGAGAAVLANRPPPKCRRIEWKFGSSRLAPDQRDALRFSYKNGMLRNILLPQVPQIAGDEAAKLLAGSLADAGVKRDGVAGWILHTGGRDVLLALCDKLNLSESDVRHSTSVLREFGNLSSPTVFFVLERALRDTMPDGLWWMSAFGAGFSCHGALLKVDKFEPCSSSRSPSKHEPPR
jgi:predicted naringenin-chalcone synthase